MSLINLEYFYLLKENNFEYKMKRTKKIVNNKIIQIIQKILNQI